MNELQQFNFEGTNIRTVLINDEPYFVGKDVTDVLEYSNTSKAISDHINDKHKQALSYNEMLELGIKTNPNGGYLIDEARMFRLVMKSHAKNAEPFQDWVTDEVLPAIRKTGAYRINPVEQLLADPVAIGQMMIEYGQTKEHLAIAEQRIAEYEPRISYLDTILASKDTVTTSQIAADYGMSAVAMNRMLHNFRVQHKVGDQWLLYVKHMHNGYTKSETAVVKHRNGERKTVMNTKWTQKGRIFIYDLLKEQGVLPESEKMEVSA